MLLLFATEEPCERNAEDYWGALSSHQDQRSIETFLGPHTKSTRATRGWRIIGLPTKLLPACLPARLPTFVVFHACLFARFACLTRPNQVAPLAPNN